jgi:hypothetical protein
MQGHFGDNAAILQAQLFGQGGMGMNMAYADPRYGGLAFAQQGTPGQSVGALGGGAPAPPGFGGQGLALAPGAQGPQELDGLRELKPLEYPPASRVSRAQAAARAANKAANRRANTDSFFSPFPLTPLPRSSPVSLSCAGRTRPLPAPLLRQWCL